MTDKKEPMGIVAEGFAFLGTRVLERAVQQGTEAGIKAALNHIEEEKKAHRKGRYDKRLRNTRLLLKNYRAFKDHAAGAVYSARKAKESAIDILDGLDEKAFDDDLYIESISRSQQRTIIIVNHIEEMLNYYRISCEESGRPEEIRRYRVIMGTYIEQERKTAEEIAAQEHIERRTVYKDINAAIKPLSALIFGIDSLKLY